MLHVIRNSPDPKTCLLEYRKDLCVAEQQTQDIAAHYQPGFLNLREVHGGLKSTPTGEVWVGDTLGRIAEGLTNGRIQLQQNETTQPLTGERCSPVILREEAKGWKEVFVTYVYLEDNPSERLQRQARNNPSRTLFTADIIYPGQYVGVTSDLEVVIGDHSHEVIKYIRGKKVNIIPQEALNN